MNSDLNHAPLQPNGDIGAAGAIKTAQRMAGRFSLVELLVVVAIIAILSGILMPALNKARLKVHESACMNNLRQFGTILSLYASDNNDRLPSKGWSWEYSLLTNGYINTNPTPAGLVAGTGDALFQCPSDNMRRTTATSKVRPKSYQCNGYLYTSVDGNCVTGALQRVKNQPARLVLLLCSPGGQLGINDGSVDVRYTFAHGMWRHGHYMTGLMLGGNVGAIVFSPADDGSYASDNFKRHWLPLHTD